MELWGLDDGNRIVRAPDFGHTFTMLLNEEDCWAALVSRNKDWNGRFLYGVLSTGVYCHPACSARTPLRKNVRFYLTPAEAERDGLRPCLRCRPTAALDPNADRIRELCEYIRARSDSGDPITLEDLGRRAKLSPSHLQRIFKAAVGLTPNQYVEACRLQSLKGQLRSAGSVTDAIYGAGFGSSSRVYERVDTRLGMTPAEYRAGAEGVQISYVSVESPLGLMMVGATDRGLCFVQWGETREELLGLLRREYPAAELQEMKQPYSSEFTLWMDALGHHLSGAELHLDLPVDVRATAFQLKVWRYLQSIPYGEVQSYSEVASAIGQPTAARAVARACASNRVALVIPCHRVIRGTGELGGYRWGLERKRVLIDRERANRT
jgi:AraC family transcriptional regulator of adaptative response/methylated-DNA-[protein]-cysteine methyltransferase